jgi:hypothetical protein
LKEKALDRTLWRTPFGRSYRPVEDRLQNEINELGCWLYYCSRTFLVYLFIRFAHISYRRYIAIHFDFKLSTYIYEPLVVGGIVSREGFKRKNG